MKIFESFDRKNFLWSDEILMEICRNSIKKRNSSGKFG